MSAPTVSVAVVSRGRPALLRRALTGIGQLCYPAFEIIVVADPVGIGAAAAMGWGARIKLVPFDEPSISRARNLAIAEAAGEVIAFIDDDAVPEPTWLKHLAAGFDLPGVGGVGGFVRGRNGIAFQSRANLISALGATVPIETSGDAPFVPDVPGGHAVKTEGTNCAFRRDRLAAMGGFDPAIRFYHDETDLDMRLAAAGIAVAIAPGAQVHHGQAASAHRTADRAPTDLTEIGASTAVFWRKHAPSGTDLAGARAALIAAQRKRLLRYMVSGALEPHAVRRRLAGLQRGLDEGAHRPLAPLAPIGPPTNAFLPFEPDAKAGAPRLLSGRPWSRARLREEARRAVRQGDRVTIIRLSPTALPHQVRFHEGGWWEQRGGLFGRAEHGQVWFKLHTFAKRVALEWKRVEMLRDCR